MTQEQLRRRLPDARPRSDRQQHRERVSALESQRRAVIQRAGDPRPWLDAHRDDLARLAAVRTELARREGLRIELATRTATIDPPEHIIRAIGPPPVEPTARDTWNRAARHVEGYRQRHARDLTPATPGLGPAPRDPAARVAWREHQRSVDELTRRLDRPHERPVADLGPDR